MDSLVVQNISVKYGNKLIIDNANFVLDGGVCSILGRNGAGKTSLMKVIATLQLPSKGIISFKNNTNYRSSVGYVPQHIDFIPHWSALRTMKYFSELRRIKLPNSRIDKLLDDVGLSKPQQHLREFSGGMKRRLALAVSLIGNPDLLIIDEPTSGVDPEGRTLIRKIIGNISRDRNIVLSTHTISDIEWLANRVIILKDGKIGFNGKTHELIDSQCGKIWQYRIPLTSEIDKTDSIISISRQEDSLSVVQISNDRPNNKSDLKSPTLEEAYLAFLQF